MTERDAIFRERLIALMTALRAGEGKDVVLRRTIGRFVQALAKETGARSWTDIKKRTDPATYDSMLQLFQRESASYQKAGDAKSVRALEALGISLIARHQKQADLLPGVGFLDTYIDECAAAVKRASTRTVNHRPAAH